MSIIDEVKKDHELHYREHKMINVDGRDVCQDCQMYLWDEDFPTYCQGPTTILELGTQDTNDDSYEVTAKLLHLHSRALIEMKSGDNLDDGVFLDMDAVDVQDLIDKLLRIHNLLITESK